MLQHVRLKRVTHRPYFIGLLYVFYMIPEWEARTLTYLDRINDFWNQSVLAPFTTNQVALYLALLDCANRNHWKEWTTVSLSGIGQRIGISSSGISKAKDGLVKRGLIDYRKSEDGKTGIFKLLDSENVTSD